MSNLRNALRGARLKWKRGNDHLQSLEASIQSFMDGGPLQIWPVENEPPGTFSAEVVIYSDPPEEWGVVFGDSLQNFRVSLDYLVHELAKDSGLPFKANETQFPIESDRSKYFKNEKRAARKYRLQGVIEEHRQIIDRMQPFTWETDASDHPLAKLARLSNQDKHRSFLPSFVAASGGVFRVESSIPGGERIEIRYKSPTHAPLIKLEHKGYAARIQVDESFGEMHITEMDFHVGVGFGETHASTGDLIDMGVIIDEYLSEFEDWQA